MSVRHRRRCCWPDTSAVVVPYPNTCAGKKKKKEKTCAADCDGDQKECTMRRCEIASEGEREGGERGGRARARAGGSEIIPGGYSSSTFQCLGLDASARWVLDKYISRPVFGVGAGYPAWFFFLFSFSVFWGSCWQPFSYALALLAILKTKKC